MGLSNTEATQVKVDTLLLPCTQQNSFGSVQGTSQESSGEHTPVLFQCSMKEKTCNPSAKNKLCIQTAESSCHLNFWILHQFCFQDCLNSSVKTCARSVNQIGWGGFWLHVSLVLHFFCFSATILLAPM